MEVAFIDKIYLYPNALRYLRTNLSLNVGVSENTLPFVSQSINNFSDNDISQTHDWKCPSLSPHVLLLGDIAQNIAETGVFCSFSEGSLGRVLQELAFNLILHGGVDYTTFDFSFK